VIAFTVAQRTREFGVRMALGARPRHILRALVAPYSTAISIGALSGMALAAGAARILQNRVFGMQALDSVGYLTALTVVAAAVLGAILIPARRALRIDSATALRWE